MLSEYLFLLSYFLICFLLSTVIYIASLLFVVQTSDDEKTSAYECGFSPFNDARNKFEVKFYLVAILFIVFDLEISFLFPWTLTLGELDLFGIIVMFFFLLILTVGFIYEWISGALDW